MDHPNIGGWIAAARASKRWSQTRLGDEIGVGKANVSHWETGKHEAGGGREVVDALKAAGVI